MEENPAEDRSRRTGGLYPATSQPRPGGPEQPRFAFLSPFQGVGAP